MQWFRIKYNLPVNDGPNPETVALQAENAEEARQHVTEHFTKKCRGVYGVPEIVSVEAYDSWDDVKQSVNAGGDR